MVSIPLVIWHELMARRGRQRRPEPAEAMVDAEQVRAYVQAYEWGGPTSALQLHHLRELSRLIRPGDTVLDLACGPGPLLLELATLYRDVRFIGADLSQPMLTHLAHEASRNGLSNVSVVHEDIRTLASLGDGAVDVVISTSALHHLPDEDALGAVFRRVRTLLAEHGAFYLFDFGLLKSDAAQRLFVADVARLAPAITARDYDNSLRAAFPLGRVRDLAVAHLPRPFTFSTSALVDFLYFLQSPPRTRCPDAVGEYIDRRWRELRAAMKAEHLALRLMRTGERWA